MLRGIHIRTARVIARGSKNSPFRGDDAMQVLQQRKADRRSSVPAVNHGTLRRMTPASASAGLP